MKFARCSTSAKIKNILLLVQHPNSGLDTYRYRHQSVLWHRDSETRNSPRNLKNLRTFELFYFFPDHQPGLRLGFDIFATSHIFSGTMNVCEFQSLDFLAEDPDLQLAMLFGSAATGDLRPDSDIDIAIYPRRPMTPRNRQQVADQVAVATNRAVDLIDLSTAEGALLRKILHSGIVLFSKDNGLLGSLSERLLDWQEDFEPQLNALLEARLHRLTLPIHGS